MPISFLNSNPAYLRNLNPMSFEGLFKMLGYLMCFEAIIAKCWSSTSSEFPE